MARQVVTLNVTCWCMLTFAARVEHRELWHDIAESRHEQDFEPGASGMTHSRLHDQVNTLEELGLDEIEAVEYVLMLSRDEEETRTRANAPDGLSRSVGSDDRPFSHDIMEAIQEPSVDIVSGTFPAISASGYASTSSSVSHMNRSQSSHVPTPIPSPPLSSAPFLSTFNFISSGHPRSTGSSKIVVSPRTRSEPTEAGRSLDSNVPLCPSSPRENTGTNFSSLDDVFPLMSIASGTTTHPLHRRASIASIDPWTNSTLSWPNPSSSSSSTSPTSPRRSWSTLPHSRTSTTSPTPPQTFPAMIQAEHTTDIAPSITPQTILQDYTYAATTSRGAVSSPITGSGIARSRNFPLNVSQSPSQTVSTTVRIPAGDLRSTQVDEVSMEAPKSREAEAAELALAIEMSLAEAGKSGQP